MDSLNLDPDPGFWCNLDMDPKFMLSNPKFKKKLLRKTISFKKVFFNQQEIMAPEESQWGLLSINSEFLSSTLHFLFLIYPIFTSVGPDPYSEYGSNLDPDPKQWCVAKISSPPRVVAVLPHFHRLGFVFFFLPDFDLEEEKTADSYQGGLMMNIKLLMISQILILL